MIVSPSSESGLSIKTSTAYMHYRKHYVNKHWACNKQTNKCNLRAGLVFAFTQRRSWSFVMSMAVVRDLIESILGTLHTYSSIPFTFILVPKALCLCNSTELFKIVPLKLHRPSLKVGAATLNLKKYLL